MIAPTPHRLHSLERLLVTAELIQGSRFGLATLDLSRGLGERLGRSYSVRTVNRDVALLQHLGYVARDGHRWRWLAGRSLLEEGRRTA